MRREWRMKSQTGWVLVTYSPEVADVGQEVLQLALQVSYRLDVFESLYLRLVKPEATLPGMKVVSERSWYASEQFQLALQICTSLGVPRLYGVQKFSREDLLVLLRNSCSQFKKHRDCVIADRWEEFYRWEVESLGKKYLL